MGGSRSFKSLKALHGIFGSDTSRCLGAGCRLMELLPSNGTANGSAGWLLRGWRERGFSLILLQDFFSCFFFGVQRLNLLFFLVAGFWKNWNLSNCCVPWCIYFLLVISYQVLHLSVERVQNTWKSVTTCPGPVEAFLAALGELW